jgi:hypothetical protein
MTGTRPASGPGRTPGTVGVPTRRGRHIGEQASEQPQGRVDEVRRTLGRMPRTRSVDLPASSGTRGSGPVRQRRVARGGAVESAAAVAPVQPHRPSVGIGAASRSVPAAILTAGPTPVNAARVVGWRSGVRCNGPDEPGPAAWSRNARTGVCAGPRGWYTLPFAPSGVATPAVPTISRAAARKVSAF